jgi:hypothetical protein
MRNAFVIFKKGKWWMDYRWRGLGSRLAKDMKKVNKGFWKKYKQDVILTKSWRIKRLNNN